MCFPSAGDLSKNRRWVTAQIVIGPDILKTGAARGIRTPDPVITNDVLYRLSYCGVRAWYLTRFSKTATLQNASRT
jgi:hypothetical protein